MPAIAAVAVTGLALLPLLTAQTNSVHIGWITNTPLPTRMLQTGASFMIGETGSVLGQPTSYGYAVAPAFLVAVATLLVALRGSAGERRAAAIGAVVGFGVLALAAAAALVGKDYVLERNLLPALVPLVLIVALAFAGKRTGLVGVAIGVALCAYWLAFDVYVTQRPSLQRPEFRSAARVLGPPHGRRAIVTWKLAADPVRILPADQSARAVRRRGTDPGSGCGPQAAGRGPPVNLPPPSTRSGESELQRLTLISYVSTPAPSLVPHLRRPAHRFRRTRCVMEAGANDERLRIRLPAGSRRPPSRQLGAAAQVRHRRRLRLPDQPRASSRFSPATSASITRSPRSAPSASP